MEDIKPEEKSPLLLYVVEGDGNVSKNNKRVSFDKGRLYGISSGATTVFTEFPNYVSPCWITTLLSGLIFFMMVLLMFSSMESARSLRVPRCTQSQKEDLNNRTIFLVHDTKWNEDHLDILQKIKFIYEGFNIHLVLLRSEVKKTNIISKLPLPISYLLKNVSKTTPITNKNISNDNQAIMEIKRAKRDSKIIRSSKRKKRDHTSKVGIFPIGMGVKSLLDILLHSRMDVGEHIKKSNHNDSLTPLNLYNFTELLPPTTTPKPTLDDIIKDFPNISLRNVTFEEAFMRSPLEKSWFKFNKELTIFAVRILHLWEFGGLSFKIDSIRQKKNWEDIENFSVAPDSTRQYQEGNLIQPMAFLDSNKLLNFINEGKFIYDTQPKEVVTADDEGLHIFAKTPCHVFFGEVIQNLKHAKGDETAKMIMQKSLRVFCKHSAVGKNYCRNLIRKG